MESEDVALLRAWRAGDPRAGSALLQRYFDSLYRFFAAKVEDEVDDLIQRTFLALVRHRDAIRDESSFRAYMFSVARREFYHHLRTHQRRRAPLDFGTVSLADLGTSPSGVVARRKDEALLVDALRRLPLDLQIALELHYWEDLSTAELAAALEIPHGTAKSTLRRARAQLRRALEEESSASPELARSLEDLDAWARAVRAGDRGGKRRP
ncbi:MAG: sigma-70 family RNA polymerase sigma factor [Myxococcales bacterium]|nr:sigma-70 family RNA polymerase sigma factor [Myxococcales bacterium]